MTFNKQDWNLMWFHKELYGASYFDGSRWAGSKTKSQEFDVATERFIKEKRERFTKSPIGYYGLHNPQRNEFCLRASKAAETSVGRDLRRVAVGRRCEDCEHGLLVSLVARKIKEPYSPPDFLDRADLEQIRERVNANRYHTEEDLKDVESMKRFLYWVSRKRSELCAKIQTWMRENDLIEPSFDCGTQQKQRGRVDQK